MALLRRFVREQEGLETVEYAVLAGLIVVGLVAAVTTLGSTIKGKFDALNTALQ